MQKDDSIVLAYSKAILIDSKGSEQGIMPGGVDTRNCGKLQSFSRVLWKMQNGNAILGLTRGTALKKVTPIPMSISPDMIQLSKLSLLGSIAHIEDPLWCRRETREQESAPELIKRHIVFFRLAQKKPSVLWAYLKLLWAHLRSVPKEFKNPLLGPCLAFIVLLRYFVVLPYRWKVKKHRPVRSE